MHLHVSSIWYINSKVEFINGTIPILGSVSADRTVQRWKSIKEKYEERTTVTLNETVHLFSDTMCYSVAFCKDFKVPPYAKTWV